MASTLRFDNWEDSNGTPILDGTNLSLPSSALPAGSILQVVSTTKVDTFSTSSTSFVDVTGLSATITPSSASSKILVTCSVSGSNSGDGVGTYFNLVRDSTNIAQSTGGSSRNQTGHIIDSQSYVIERLPVTFLDSPSTTSSTTYKIQIRVLAQTGFVNRRGDSTLDGAISSITLMEVAG